MRANGLLIGKHGRRRGGKINYSWTWPKKQRTRLADKTRQVFYGKKEFHAKRVYNIEKRRRWYLGWLSEGEKTDTDDKPSSRKNPRQERWLIGRGRGGKETETDFSLHPFPLRLLFLSYLPSDNGFFGGTRLLCERETEKENSCVWKDEEVERKRRMEADAWTVSSTEPESLWKERKTARSLVQSHGDNDWFLSVDSLLVLSFLSFIPSSTDLFSDFLFFYSLTHPLSCRRKQELEQKIEEQDRLKKQKFILLEHLLIQKSLVLLKKQRIHDTASILHVTGCCTSSHESSLRRQLPDSIPDDVQDGDTDFQGELVSLLTRK